MIDARGFSCPMPVVMVQKKVKNSAPDKLEVLVDDPCAVETSRALRIITAMMPCPAKPAMKNSP